MMRVDGEERLDNILPVADFNGRYLSILIGKEEGIDEVAAYTISIWSWRSGFEL